VTIEDVASQNQSLERRHPGRRSTTSHAAQPAKGQAPIIERHRLVEVLNADTQFTVVTAPAGSGKTILVKSWVEGLGATQPYAWASIERGELDPQRFWSTLVTKVRQSLPIHATVDELAPVPAFNAELVIARLVADLEVVGNLTIVIDDVHEVKSNGVLEQLTSFLDQLPSSVQAILISRHDPQLGLHRRRLEGQLSEIRLDQLRFTVDESKELLAAAGITLSDSGLQLLHSRTEGWVAGLRLAAVSMATHSDPEQFVLDFSGSERTVAEYLMAEVLDSLPSDVRRLLVNTSILDRVNGALGDLLTGDVGTEGHLSALAEAGGFVISLDTRGEWFRFHHLFADLLAAELRHSQAPEIPYLHLAAAHWLSDRGYVIEAITHALAAEDDDLVTRLLVEHYFSLMLDGRQATVRSLVDAVARRSDAPEIAAVLAADELIGGSLEQAAAQLALAEHRASEVREDCRRRFEIMLYATRLSLARRIGDFQSVLDAPQPDALYAEPLSNEDIAMQSDARALMLMNLGIVEVWTGRREDGEQHLTAAEDMARKIGRPYLEVSCQVHRAQSLTWSSFAAARSVAEAVIATTERHGWQDDPVAGAALVVLGSCVVATGRVKAAEQAFCRADRSLRSDLEPTVGFVLHTGHGIVNLVKADYAQAITSFLEAERLGTRLTSRSPLALMSRCAMLYSAILANETNLVQKALDEFTEAERNSGEVREIIAIRLLAEGDAHGALAALEPTVTETTRVHHGLVLIRSLLLAARARYMIDQELEAQYSIERALDLAEADEWIIPFLFIETTDLLERHPRHQTAHGGFLTLIQDVLSGRELDGDGRHPRSVAFSLSETELRVLRFLSTNLTAAEIGSEIYVSVNTVKTHMRNIYTKLDAHSRGEAVESARELGLLSHTVRSR
jgi:LuxR family maltose regulon positive regulatory protein